MNGRILYRGPSRLDGRDIVALVTGIERPSDNDKTGEMMQTWILPADEEPHEAIRSGADVSVCGDCPLRGKPCYVRVEQAPLTVFRAWRRGSYGDRPLTPAETAQLGRDRAIRLGAYGDPGAVPTRVWRALVQHARTWTGYTHQWHRRPSLRGLCMASVDTAAQYHEATTSGWRCYRAADEPLPGEVLCPNTSHGVQCVDCGLCNGARPGNVRSVYNPPHGSGAGLVRRIGV